MKLSGYWSGVCKRGFDFPSLLGGLIALIFWGLCLPPLGGQGLPYEGQPVVRVLVSAQPEIALETLRPLIVQKEAEPYSTEKVRASMAALYRTGRFKDIQVDVQPEPGGLRVTFLLQPAYYIGMLYFPGAARVFTYSRLLQVANIPSQEVYTETRAAEAEAALLRFFKNQGFFAATLQRETQFDEVNLLAHLTFRVTLNRQARIGRIEVTGPSDTDVLQVRKVLGLKSGKLYTPQRLDAAKRRVQNYFRSQGRLTSQARLASSFYHEDSRQVDLSFELVIGPVVSVTTTGGKVSKRTLRDLIPIYEEGTFDSDLVNEGERNLVNYFQSKGYFDAEVKAQINDDTGRLGVVYEINKGRRHKVAQVSFRGHTYFTEDELLARLSIREGHWFSHGLFNDDLLRRSVDTLKALYINAGFEEVKIDPQVRDQEPEVFVTFQIQEGPQTRVDSLRLEGNTALSVTQLAPEGLNLRPGQPFSDRRLAEDRDRILATYLDTGFLSATFDSKVSRRSEDPHRVEVLYVIHEGRRTYVGDVVVLGRLRTQEVFINSTAQIEPNQPLSQGKLLESESRLYNLNIFDYVSVAPRRPIADQPREEVLLRVHEAKRNTVTYGFGFEATRRGGSFQSGGVVLPNLPPIQLGTIKINTSEKTFYSPRGSVEYSRRNLRGLGQTASVAARMARLQQRGIFAYSDPHFRGSNWSSLFSLFGERTTENPVFTARRLEGSFQLEKRRGESTTLLFRYSFRRTSLTRLLIPDLVPPADLSTRLSTLSTSWVRDTRDKPLDAHKGMYQTLDFGWTPKVLGSSASFVRLLGQTASYRPVKSSMIWANSLRLGLAKAYGREDIPLSERFFSGGSTTLRGFPINGAGPQRRVAVCSKPGDPSTCTQEISLPIGGDALVVLNSELRFPLPFRKGLGGVLFYDGGNVYRRVGVINLKNYTNSVGFGLRYETPVGPVRFDVGRNLNPVPGVGRTQFFITLGQAF